MTRTRIMDRRALFASGVAAALLAASGVSAGPAPRRGGKLRLALSGAARTDSWTKGHGVFMQVARQGMVFDTLTEVAADGTLRGELATAWESNATATDWRFTLRNDVFFHQGQRFGPMDVVHSLRIKGFDAHVDGADVVVSRDIPAPDLPFTLSEPEFVIMPQDGSGAAGNGTGLYRVTRFEPGRQVLAERVADHYRDGQSGWFDQIELVSLTNEEVRLQALGEYLVDAVDVSPDQLLADLPDHVLVENTAAVRDLMQPARIGTQRPLDNLRATERWWLREGL